MIRKSDSLCCDSCSTVVSLAVPTCAKRANSLHMEERAMTNNEDGSYGLLSRPPFEGPLGVNPKRLRSKDPNGILLAPSARSRQPPDSARSHPSHEPRLGRIKVDV